MFYHVNNRGIEKLSSSNAAAAVLLSAHHKMSWECEKATNSSHDVCGGSNDVYEHAEKASSNVGEIRAKTKV